MNLKSFINRLKESLGLSKKKQIDNGFTPSRNKTPNKRAKTNKVNFTFGDYEVIDTIGEGGMGFVYRARQTKLNRIVALKTIREEVAKDEQVIKRFEIEARALARLTHPNITQIFEFDRFEGTPFIAMEFVEGSTLDVLWQGDKAPSIKETAKIAIGICEGLSHAHEKGVLHRDLKPANILLTNTDKNPKITDFGLARELDLEEHLTVSGTVLGTPVYMSPEQAQGKSNIDERSDIFSFGSVLFKMLTGFQPFDGESYYDIIDCIITGEPKKINLLRENLPRDIITIVQKCMEKDLGRRYQNMADVATDLELFLSGEPINAKAPSLYYIVGKNYTKRKSVYNLAMSLLVLASITMALLLVFQDELRKGKSDWELVFEDDFERENLGPNWLTDDGEKPYIENGELVLKTEGSLNIVCQFKVEGDIKIEFDAYVHPESDGICDISTYLKCASLRPARTGYYLGFGDNYNTHSYMYRETELIVENPTAVIQGKGVKHHMVATFENQKLSYVANNELINEYFDLFPLDGQDNSNCGFYNFKSTVHYDNVRIYTKALPEKVSRIKIADVMYQKDMFEEASKLYHQIAESNQNISWASYKACLTDYILAVDFDKPAIDTLKLQEIRNTLLQIIEEKPGTDILIYSQLLLLKIYAFLDNKEDALSIYHALHNQYTSNSKSFMIDNYLYSTATDLFVLRKYKTSLDFVVLLKNHVINHFPKHKLHTISFFYARFGRTDIAFEIGTTVEDSKRIEILKFDQDFESIRAFFHDNKNDIIEGKTKLHTPYLRAFEISDTFSLEYISEMYRKSEKRKNDFKLYDYIENGVLNDDHDVIILAERYDLLDTLEFNFFDNYQYQKTLFVPVYGKHRAFKEFLEKHVNKHAVIFALWKHESFPHDAVNSRFYLDLMGDDEFDQLCSETGLHLPFRDFQKGFKHDLWTDEVFEPSKTEREKHRELAIKYYTQFLDGLKFRPVPRYSFALHAIERLKYGTGPQMGFK